MTACPTPGKVQYASREAAVFFARSDGMRAYRCACGEWHLSSQAYSHQKIGISKRRSA